MYTMLPWVIARWLIDFPVMLLQSLLMTVTVYFMVGLEGKFGKFWFAWFSSYYVNSAVIDFAAQLAATQESADGSCTIINSINLIFAGFFVTYDTLPVYFEWAYWISTLHYGFGAVGLNEFEVNVVFFFSLIKVFWTMSFFLSFQHIILSESRLKRHNTTSKMHKNSKF